MPEINALIKSGGFKIIGLLAALMGAAIITAFRPPKSRKELFLQGSVALGTSVLLGGTVIEIIGHYVPWMDLSHNDIETALQYTATVHGLLGAMAWGIFGGLAVLRDKIYDDPVKAIKDIKDTL